MNLTLESAPTTELFGSYVVPTYGRFPLAFERGEGAWVWDENGRKYLDFGAGIAVCSIGHCHPRVVEVMARQLGRLVHTSNLYYTRPQGLLARKLVELVGLAGKIFFCNSGAEANEALYKLARKFGNETVSAPPGHTVGEVIEPERDRLQDPDVHGILPRADAGGHLRDRAGEGEERLRADGRGVRASAIQRRPGAAGGDGRQTAAVLLEPVQGESGIHAGDARISCGWRGAFATITACC